MVCGGALVGVSAYATLIQENFDSLPVQAGVPAGWFEGYNGPGASWEVIDDGGNHVLKAVSGPPSGGDALALPDNGVGWFVENLEMQVMLNIQSGSGAGIGVGQFDGNAYVGNAYYVEVSKSGGGIGLMEEGLSAGSDPLQIVAPYALDYNQWYDLRWVSTGTAFQVWFRVHSTAPWDPADKIIDVPQDLLHPGHKSYVEGYAACYAQNGDGPSTALFDDFRLEAVPFVAPTAAGDDFEDSVHTAQTWSAIDVTTSLVPLGGSQAIEVASTGPTGGLALNQGSQFYSHNFVMRTSLYVEDGTSGGLFWALDSAAPGTDFHIEIAGTATDVIVDFDEEQNSVSGNDETQLGFYSETATLPGWYNVEVSADYRRYKIWFWHTGDPQPAIPVIDVPQDLAHPGYRLILLGGNGIWVNNGQTVVFDDFSFDGLEAPTLDTPPGGDVTVQPDPNLGMTFENVTTGGTTTVETSTTAPGGGPGGLAFRGTYYDVSTTAVYDGIITLCFSYDDTGMTLAEEQNLRLMHWDAFSSVWEDITTSVDPVNNVVCGQTDSLSVFGLAVAPTVEGFLQPVNMPPSAMSIFRGRSTVPLKFRLAETSTGESITDATATVWIQKVSNGVPGDVNEVVESTQPDGGNAFRYAGNGQYIFNLSTRNLTAGVYRIHADILGGLIDLWVDVAVK